MKDFYDMLGITANPSMVYHPQTNGQTGRKNAEIKKYLHMFVNNRQDDWADWVSLAEFMINNRTASLTGQSPFFLNLG